MQDTTLLKAVPVLPAQDLAATLAFYRDVLGFEGGLQVSEEYGIVERDGVDIHFWHCEDRKIAEASGCRIQVQHLQPLYEACRRHGVIHPNGDLAEKPWGAREFSIIDPNSNLLTFSESLATSP